MDMVRFGMLRRVLLHKFENSIVHALGAHASSVGQKHVFRSLGKTELFLCLGGVPRRKCAHQRISHTHKLGGILGKTVRSLLKVQIYPIDIRSEHFHRDTGNRIRLMKRGRHMKISRRFNDGKANVPARSDNYIGLEFTD